VMTGTVPSALFPARPAAREIRSPVRPRRRWAGALFSVAVVGACAWVLGLGVREGRIRVPTKADVMQLPAHLSSLRLSLEQRMGRHSSEPVHSGE
jgi:ferric-dicitrate binding protein FerR (iron transport regulator)